MRDDTMWIGPPELDPAIEVRRKSATISRVGRKESTLGPDPNPESTDRIKDLIGKLKTLRSAPDLPGGYGPLIDEIVDELESFLRDGASQGADGAGKKSAWVVPDSQFHAAPRPRAPALRGLANFETMKKAVPRIFQELEIARLQAGVRDVEVGVKKLRSDVERSDGETARRIVDRVTDQILAKNLRRGRSPP